MVRTPSTSPRVSFLPLLADGRLKGTLPGGYHWFDGDGMIHGVRITKDGTVNYLNRWTRTYRLAVEDTFKRPMFTRLGEANGRIFLLKSMVEGIKKALGGGYAGTPLQDGTANTSRTFPFSPSLTANSDHQFTTLMES
jgi:hypothetical protein